ncbi:MAG: glycosyltransferase family 39 protein [Reyranella sp.]|uniref:glycosyltransferase family 39 protein n=1 Tax=Reyranella sp. TaxID=1929291 RepID=UPI0025D62648|nr:glycosyltransferase family 39 protein [Reyranella sp.]MBR2814046.1 glycosyltransferase family 39 protein [Reyranella sp.]
MVVLLGLAAALRLWRLEANGFGNEYYAAGVRSMLQGLHLFFYNAFDPAGLVSLDKPPLAFWIQTVSARLLGYDGWAIHLPQALAGAASVGLVYALTRRFGRIAAFIAALLLALTPIAVASDRSNNTDSWLVFFLLLAAWLALRGRGLSFVFAMMVLGLAFNVKMLAALVCGPALLAGWWLAGTLDWRQRLAWMAAGGVALAVVALSWAVVFDLTPPPQRPVAGSSPSNSMLELIVRHNGVERFARATSSEPAAPRRFLAYDAVPVGPLRLAEPMLAAQFSWALPLAILGAALTWRRRPAAVALLAVWALTYAIVYSAAGGIFHIYYLVTLAPPMAALAGIGCYELWRRGPRYLALGLATTALWQGYLTGATLGWLDPWMGFPAVALLAAGGTLLRDKRPPAVIGAIALAILPTFWVLSVLFAPGNLTLPSASLPRWLGKDDGRGPILSRSYRSLTDDPKLIAFLREHRGSARFLAATPTALLAAPLIIRTGEPVLPFGGYLGNDPIMSVEDFASRVERGEVRYVLLGTARRPADFEAWVIARGTPVDSSLWRSLPPEPRRLLTLYDLSRPRQR